MKLRLYLVLFHSGFTITQGVLVRGKAEWKKAYFLIFNSNTLPTFGMLLGQFIWIFIRELTSIDCEKFNVAFAVKIGVFQ